MDNVKILEVKQSIFASNDEQAAQLRQSLKEKKIFLLNLMSAPGSGKTTTLRSTIAALKDELRIGVMEADIDSDVDAKAIAAAGAKAIQLHTGGMCHLDAEMTRQGLEGLDPAPLPEETGTPTTGGIELDTEDAEGGNDTSSTTEDTESTDTEESTGAAETMTDEEMAALLSSLLGSQVDVTVTDEGIQLTNKDDGTPNQTGTVVTNGGNLNVRTGAGTDNQAFTQLPNGTQVEVIGTEDNGWVKILLPEREGYVCPSSKLALAA